MSSNYLSTYASENNNEDISREDQVPQSCYQNLKHILESPRLNLVIIVLGVIDCLCMAGELIIESIENGFEKQCQLETKNMFLRNSTLSIECAYDQIFSLTKISLPILHVLELVCKYTSFTILSLFMCEIFMKLFYEEFF